MLDKARETSSEHELVRALKMFKCDINSDIEHFLHNKAIDFADRDICRVYLILDECEFEKNHICIEAYFTLSLSTLNFVDSVSKSTRRRITGFKDKDAAEFILVGQLGKYIDKMGDNTYSAMNLQGILQYIYDLVYLIDELVPCNAILVECSEAVHEKGIYQNEGFKLLQRDDEFYQYYIKI